MHNWLPPIILLAAACAPMENYSGLSAAGRVLRSAESTGTGFSIDSNHLLTAAHVVVGCGAIWSVSDAGDTALAHAVAVHDDLDVAVLRTDGRSSTQAQLATTVALPGTTLLAVGYPGETVSEPAAQVAFRSILLPLPRPDERMALRGVARPGMSGSPLLDASGAVAGMLIGKGDPAAHGSAGLAKQLGFSVGEIAMMVPAPWLRAAADLAGATLVPASGLGQTVGAPTPVRIVCTTTPADDY